jgi:beta-glucanase (GH16 family)
MEHVGYDVNRIYGTIHTGAFNHTLGTQKGSNIMVPTAYTGFHDYAIEWDAENISIFVDEKSYLTFKNLHKTSAEWPFDKRFHLLLNILLLGVLGVVLRVLTVQLPKPSWK